MLIDARLKRAAMFAVFYTYRDFHEILLLVEGAA
jgi:hypothetical protein